MLEKRVYQRILHEHFLLYKQVFRGLKNVLKKIYKKIKFHFGLKIQSGLKRKVHIEIKT